jgi:hypothetical protein
MKNKSKHDQRQAGGKREIPASVKFAGQSVGKSGFLQKAFFVVRIYYLKNAICRGFHPDFAGAILFTP